MTRRLGIVCLALLGVALAAHSTAAQHVTGSLSGQVLDPQDLVVAGAKVTISNEATGFKKEVETSQEGTFLVLDLPPAIYKVTIQATNFKTYVTTVTVRVGVVATVTAKLELGEATAIVEVESGVVTVDPTKQTVQGVVLGRQIDALPLNGRNFLDLAQLDPGVQIVDGGTFDPTKNQFAGVSIGGRSGRVTRIQVDGVDITDETVGTTVANLSNESIQEFGISQSSLDPSTDVTSSGAVNIITKSGTNEIHGSGFLLWRDESFAADQRLTKVGSKPPFDREIWGGRVGGPFIKERWFWHVEYEQSSQDAIRVTNIPEFPQFTGVFGAPVDETMAGVRTDINLTKRWTTFYRFVHNHNIGVTGFGGRDLGAFSNLNNTNIHVAGADFRGDRWTHSLRHSYLNFNNFIAPANSQAGTPDTLDPQGRPVLVRILGVLQDVGPDLLAPQQTFQDNRQTKLDSSFTRGRHSMRFGAEWNRIEQFVFASFFGEAPRIRASRNATTIAFANTNPFSPAGAADPLNYPLNQIVLGNGLGFFSEKPALGFPFGGTINHRLGFYWTDSWKWTPNFTLNFGVRYNWHSNLSNSDLPRTPLIGLFDQQLVATPRRDQDDIAPQAGFAWNVFGDGKTVIRGGAGIFYETNIFNNILFDRVINIPPGIGNDTPVITAGFPFLLHPATGATLFNFSTQCTGANPGGSNPNSCFGAALGRVIPFVVAAQQQLQQISQSLTAGWPPPGVPPLFDQILDTAGSAIDPNYKTPYGIQMNIGIQRQLKPGLVLAVDYVHNRGVHFNLIRDRNRLGAADTLHVPTALAAIEATIDAFDCANSTLSDGVDCVIGEGGTISDFADHGLGAGSGVDGFAFGGRNRNFRGMGVIEPQGLSRYQALQVRLTGDIGQFSPLGIRRLYTNITYSLGRFESTGVDQDFLSGAAFNDRPTKFFGPANLDRTHQVGLSFLIEFPWGFNVNTTSAFRTALATSMFLPLTTGGADEIFFSDVDGDGVVEDPLPGTNRGSYSRGVHAGNVARVIADYNSRVAGTLSPAAVALVQAGLFTQEQLIALGAVLTSVTPPPANQVNNDSFINTDIRISNKIRIGEQLVIEPMMEVFNLFNIANYAQLTAVLDGNPGNVNGTPQGRFPTRVGQGSGSFSPGTQRAFQFGVRVTW